MMTLRAADRPIAPPSTFRLVCIASPSAVFSVTKGAKYSIRRGGIGPYNIVLLDQRRCSTKTTFQEMVLLGWATSADEKGGSAALARRLAAMIYLGHGTVVPPADGTGPR